MLATLNHYLCTAGASALAAGDGLVNAHQLKATGRSSSRGSSSTRRRLGGGNGASPPSSSSERRLEPSDGRLRVEPPSGGSDGSESAAPKGVRVGSDSSSRRMLPPSAGRRSECESPPVPPDDDDRYDSDDSEDEVDDRPLTRDELHAKTLRNISKRAEKGGRQKARRK